MIADTYRQLDRLTGRTLMTSRLIESITLVGALKKRAAEVLAKFNRPATANRPTNRRR